MTWLRRALATIVVAVLLLLTGCSQTFPDDLRDLKADPMASAELANTTAARVTESDAEVGGVTGKPTEARIHTVYSIADADASSVKQDAVQQAVRTGWDIKDPNAEVVVGTKELDTGQAEIAIYFVEEDGEQRLLIRLVHDFDHPH
jgi:hypothetical protein